MEQDLHVCSSLAGIHKLAYKFSEKNQLCRYAPLICNDFGVGFSFHWHTCIYFFATQGIFLLSSFLHLCEVGKAIFCLNCFWGRHI